MSGLMKQTLQYFGFGGSEAAQYPATTTSTRQTAAQPRPVSALRPARRGGYSDVTEIATMQPRSYEDAPAIAERFREGTPVIVNMGEMSEAECRRLLDFMAGLKEGLQGQIKRVTQKVFLLSPAGVAIDEDEETPASLEASDDLVIRPFN